MSPFYLCRMFRLEGQSNDEARRQWKLLGDLERGVVYAIDNSYPSAGSRPRPAFRMVAMGDDVE